MCVGIGNSLSCSKSCHNGVLLSVYCSDARQTLKTDKCPCIARIVVIGLCIPHQTWHVELIFLENCPKVHS